MHSEEWTTDAKILSAQSENNWMLWSMQQIITNTKHSLCHKMAHAKGQKLLSFIKMVTCLIKCMVYFSVWKKITYFKLR